MSALRAVHRVPAWTKSDYVCLCCRRRLLAQGQQERTFSSSAAASREIDDDWFANFNNLYAEPLAKKHGNAQHEPKAKEKVAQPPEKKETRRERMTARSFSSLKSSLSSRLRIPPAAGSTQDQNGDPSEESGLSAAYESYQPFPKVSSSNADPSLFNELRANPRNGIRKKDSRRAERRKPVVDVYQPKPAAAPASSGRPQEEKFEAMIQELQAIWSIKTLQMLQDIQRKRKEAKRPEITDGSESPKMFDSAVAAPYQFDVVSSVQDPPGRADRTYKRVLNTTWRAVKTEGVDRAPGMVTELVEPRAPDPTPKVPPERAEVSESAKQIMPHATMSSLLVDLAKTRSGIVESGKEGSDEGEPEYRAEFDAGPGSAHGERADTSRPPYRNVDWNLHRHGSFRTYSTHPHPPFPGRSSFKDDKAEPTKNSGTRAMSTMAQKATELLHDLNSSKEPIPPWGIDGSKADPKVDTEVPPLVVDASQILETLHPKVKATKASRASKSEGKAKKVSGKKSNRARSGDESKEDAGSKKSQGRRSRSKVALKKDLAAGVAIKKQQYSKVAFRKQLSPGAVVRKQVSPGAVVRKHSVLEHPRSEPPQAESMSAEPTTKGRRRPSVRAIKSKATETSTGVDVKDGEEGNTVLQPHPLQPALSALDPSDVVSIDATNLEITPLNISQPPVPGIQHGLDRVLFNPGVFQLQDPHSRVYNFDPYLQKIMPVVEFDYNALKQYKTSSQDTALSDLAKEHGKRYIGSTSSMTGTLGHFHYLISNFRPLNLKMLSRSFPDSLESFTQINRAPNAIFLRNKGDGIYAIDADKEFDGPNVLMMLGKSMEKLLTLPKADYERYKKEHSHLVTEEERTAPEAYEYTTMGDFLMRSQLDAHDSRLPGTGMFDLKTRAVVSIRMNASDYEPMTGYEIQTLQGRFQSYEREYYDMMRSTMLKYMLQVRMGRMDGIFLAYHNVERIFGFQYIPLHEIDRAIHGQTSSCLGDQEFKLSLDLLNKVLDKATAKFPDASLRLHFETLEEQIGGGSPTTMMWVYAEPMSEDAIDHIQSGSHERTAEFERTMMGIDQDESVDIVNEASAEDNVNESEDTTPERPEAELAVLPDSDTSSTTNTDAPPSTEDAEYSSTITNAAPMFTGTLETHVERELQPLFAASIVCKSRVNGSAQPRPEKLRPNEKWELEYLLQEWDTSELTWARYEDLKSRRKTIFDKLRKENEDENGGEEDGVDKKKNAYIDFLKSMSQQGRAFRDRMNELEAGKEPVVVGRPFGKVEAGVEKIEGLDDYLGWLYRTDSPKAQES